MKDFFDYSLKEHNTFNVDVKCRRFVEFGNVDDLQNVLSSLGESDNPTLVIGEGSNLLFTKDYEGTILHSAIKGYEAKAVEDGVLLRCGSGEIWDDIVSVCVENNWYGLENLSLIPGEVGSSAVQNIGAYGSEVKDSICKVEAVEISTGKSFVFDNNDCGYSYRKSKFKDEWKNRFIITYVTYKLQNKFSPKLEYGNIRTELEKDGIAEPDARQLRNVIIKIRQAKLPDPKVEGNAGSFFMNPIVTKEKYKELSAVYDHVPHYETDACHVKIPAGWMIDKCGWKGRTVGHVGVHANQALVLVNKGGATGNDILELCNMIKEDVKNKFGIELRPEVNIF